MSPEEELARFRDAERILHGVHNLMNANVQPDLALESTLNLLGQSLGADRAYTFTVTADRTHSSCTYEWTRRPELALKPFLQNVDQHALPGWLDRFKRDTSIQIEDVANPPEDLRLPAAKFARDQIRSIYVFGFFDDGELAGYLGVDYVDRVHRLDRFEREVLFQVASSLNLFVLRHDALELWNRTAEDLPSALFIKDVDNGLRYSYTNPRYRKFFGEEIVGRDDLDVFGPELGAAYRAEDLECLRTGLPKVLTGSQQMTIAPDDGYYSVVKFPVSTKMGGHYIAGFITDITTEHKLRMQALELLEKARAAERAKSLFLAAMSHEIRTPLNVIIGLVDELKNADVNAADRAEYLASVASSSKSLLALINDVLDMSKIEAGQMHMVKAETDMDEFFGEFNAVFSDACRQRGLEFTCALVPGCPHLMVDASRIRQIVFNLVGNAIKFTRQGGVCVAGAFTPTSDTAGEFMFSVRDTGIGISPRDQEKVFGLFEQASGVRGTRVANQGTGLGLCLCKRLAECLGGDIKVESEIGKGSVFTVTLANVEFVRSKPQPSAAPETADDAPLAPAGRVLVVDDIPLNLKVMDLLLRRAGVSATLASDAKEALEALSKGGFGYVLTDMWMPGMNGEDLARAIRADPALANLKIAAQTADVEAANNFDVSLFDAVIAKPVTAGKVREFLR